MPPSIDDSDDYQKVNGLESFFSGKNMQDFPDGTNLTFDFSNYPGAPKKRELAVELTTNHMVWNPTDFTIGIIDTMFHINSIDRDFFKGKKILDLGSGTGILGIIAGKLGASHIDFSDINPFALASTEINAQKNLEGVCSYSVIESDCFDNIGAQYDIIISNPPTAIEINENEIKEDAVHWNENGKFGRYVTDRLIQESKGYLVTSGALLISTSSKQGFSLTKEKLSQHFGAEDKEWSAQYKEIPLSDWYAPYIELYKKNAEELGVEKNELFFVKDGRLHQRIYFVIAFKISH